MRSHAHMTGSNLVHLKEFTVLEQSTLYLVMHIVSAADVHFATVSAAKAKIL
jgi:hypothetical protein